MLVEVVTAYVGGATADARPADWDLDTLWAALDTALPGGNRTVVVDPRRRRPRGPQNCSTRWSPTPNERSPNGRPTSRRSRARGRCACGNATSS